METEEPINGDHRNAFAFQRSETQRSSEFARAPCQHSQQAEVLPCFLHTALWGASVLTILREEHRLASETGCIDNFPGRQTLTWEQEHETGQ